MGFKTQTNRSISKYAHPRISGREARCPYSAPKQDWNEQERNCQRKLDVLLANVLFVRLRVLHRNRRRRHLGLREGLRVVSDETREVNNGYKSADGLFESGTDGLRKTSVETKICQEEQLLTWF